MTEQVLRQLEVRTGGRYVDATLGEGGHSEALLARVGTDGCVIGLDRDPAMLDRARRRLGERGPEFQSVRARFSALGRVLAGLEVDAVDGVLFDLGLCSAQLDDRSRGFSFLAQEESAPLDMRMDAAQGESAAELIARLDTPALSDLLRRGGVPNAQRAAALLHSHMPLRTVSDLLRAVEQMALPARRHHPATLVFQALRMAVNDETRELEEALETARDVLRPGGRLVVLSYHSGEDRIVKRFLAREARGCTCPPELPVCGCGRRPTLRILASGEQADPDEIAANPRARSARLRAAERLA